ncbi:MAG: ABC transporter ATP-binding protein, partial [Bacteroidota bacterium]
MSELSSEAVRLRDVSHRYATRLALSNLNLHVPAGGLFGLLGPNGSGKTTLFRILSTLLRPSEGEALVFGHSTAHAPAAVRARLGVVFQQPALDDELTVEENLRIHGTLYGLSARDLSERLDDLLPRFGLAERRQEKPPVLSGGLRRRVDLVRGLLHRPALLLLDEP